MRPSSHDCKHGLTAASGAACSGDLHMMSSAGEHRPGLGAAYPSPSVSGSSLANTKIDDLAMYAPRLRGPSWRPCEASEIDDATSESSAVPACARTYTYSDYITRVVLV